MKDKKVVKSIKVPENNPSVAGKYKISFIFPDKTHSVKSENIFDGLCQIKPDFIKAKCIIKVELGKKSAEHFVYPRMLKKIMVNNVSKQLLEKRFNLLLNG